MKDGEEIVTGIAMFVFGMFLGTFIDSEKTENRIQRAIDCINQGGNSIVCIETATGVNKEK